MPRTSGGSDAGQEEKWDIVARDAEVPAPAAAYILMLIAGVLVIINGLLMLAMGRSLDVVILDVGTAPGIAGVLIGLVILLAAHRLSSRPSEHVPLGAIVAVLSPLSLVLVGGGFILGSVLGIGGGILAIAWKA